MYFERPQRFYLKIKYLYKKTLSGLYEKFPHQSLHFSLLKIFFLLLQLIIWLTVIVAVVIPKIVPANTSLQWCL